MQKTAEQIEHDLLRPLFHSSGKYWVAVALATSLLLAGVAAFCYQLYNGIGVWGINSPVFWAFDITNFVFWIGISHAGTLISAILRLTNATWRRPVTRCAEAITVFSILIGAIIPLCHIGRPWLGFWMIPYPNQRHIWPNFRSPLAWDFFAISTYLTGSTTFLYLPTIPDFAAVRDASTGLRKKIYRVLALGWQGTQRQWQRLEIAMHIMAIVIIPVAVSVHTIVSWDFAMTPVPMWHSSIFGPYFVAGAIFSGIAALILAMALLRKLSALRGISGADPLREPGQAAADHEPALVLLHLCRAAHRLVRQLPSGDGGVLGEHSQAVRAAVLDHGVLQLHHPRAHPGHQASAHHHRNRDRVGTVVVGMWLERFLIVVPSLEHKFLPYSWGTYRPTWVEDTLMASSFGFMLLLYLLFSKFVPMISIWEMKVGLQPHFRVRTPPRPIVSIMVWRCPGRCPRTWRNEGPLWSLRRTRGRAARRRLLARRQLRAQVRPAADRHCLGRAPRGLRIYRRARHRQSLIAGPCSAPRSAAPVASC
jgi:formate-dependent nitrite reductase membrane component NrfD